MIRRRKGSGGVVKMILLVLVILIILAYFRINIRNIVNSSVWMDNWNFVKEISVYIWENFLKGLVTYIIGKL